jgi:hypothetical protein
MKNATAATAAWENDGRKEEQRRIDDNHSWVMGACWLFVGLYSASGGL